MKDLIKLYSVNFLSLVNIISAFIFTLLFAKIYKVGNIADAYFYSLVVYSNILLVIQLFYSTFFNVYLHIKDEGQKNNLFYMLNWILFVVVLIIIGLYFLITSQFPLLDEIVKEYLNIYIYTLFFAPFISVSIQLLNAKREYYYAYYYPIGRNLIPVLVMMLYENHSSISFLAYSFLVYDLLFSIFIFFKLRSLIGVQIPYFDKFVFFQIINKSFLDKTGQFLLGLPELLIGNLLISQFPGILAVYSYIKKFTTSLVQFIFTPQLTIFSTNIAYYIRKRKVNAISLAITRLWSRTLFYFIAASLLLVIIIKYILAIFLTTEYVETNLFFIYMIYMILFLQNIFVIFEYPYGTVINQKLLFAYALKVKLLAFLLFVILFLIYKIFFNNLYMLLSLYLPSAVFMMVLYKSKTLQILDSKGSSC